MAELLDIYTEQGQKIGTISKKDYYSWKDPKTLPWINCCTCFVIDDVNKKILFEKRGKRFLDPGKLDLCSGHVQSGEIPLQSMVRELDEELAIGEADSRNLHHLGNIKLDYTNLEDETNRKSLKCFVSIYALKMKDISSIQIDGREVIQKGWLNFDDSVGFISNSMTRLPYDNTLAPQYGAIFEKLNSYMFHKKRVQVRRTGESERNFL